MRVEDDSSVNPVQSVVSYKDAYNKYDFTMALDKVIEMYVDGRKIPADSFYLYNGIVTIVKGQIKRDKEQAIRDQEQAVRDQAQAIKDGQQAERDRMQADADGKQAEKDREQAGRDQQQAVKDQQQAERDRMQADADGKQAEKDREQAGRDQQQAVKDQQQAEVDRKAAEEDRKMVSALMSDIVKEHIMPDEKSIKQIMLDEDEFIVNGKLQSEELFKKYKAKYLKSPGYSISYSGDASNFTFSYGKSDQRP